MPNPPSRRTWLIPGLVAAILFVGAVASNLVASDLETTLKPYRPWVWGMAAIALVVAVATAIVEARRRDGSPVSDAAAQETRIVNAQGERSVAIGGNVENSTIATGDKIFGSKFDGDTNFRDKIINIQQATSAAVNALHQLRAPVGDFVGREQEIETLLKALQHGSGACISGINGMGGIGKTELALLVAQRLSNDYPDAQFFLNLQGVAANPRPPQEVMETCIRAFLGPEAKLPEDIDQLSQLYRSQLSGKRMLLLLDNAADSAQVRPLIPPPGCALLVTSRQTITLPGMTPLTLSPLTDEEAQQLLLEIAPRATPAAEQICKLCGYLPLAIRAAGSLLAITPDLDPVDYVAQLKDERNRLERIGTEGVEIGVAASFNLSYARLTPEAARVFRLLSIFPGTFDAAAAEVVCDDAGHVCLSDLVRRSLVLYDTDTKRYRLHDLARLFANAKLTAEERVVAQKRHARHYKDVLSTSNNLYLQGGEAMARGLALFDLDWGNIQAGHAWVVAHKVETDEDVARLGMSYPLVGAYILHLRQHPRERIRWLEIASVAARQLNNRDNEGAALCILGLAYADLGETQRAIQFFEQALLIDRELGDRRGEGANLGNLGNAYTGLGETQRSIHFYEQALVIAREIRDRRDEGNALGGLGNAYWSIGENQRALQFYEQALLIDREIGDRRGEGTTLNNLGLAYADIGETQRALQFFEQQLTIAREIGDRRGESRALWNISLTLDEVVSRSLQTHSFRTDKLRRNSNDEIVWRWLKREIAAYPQNWVKLTISDTESYGVVLYPLKAVEATELNHINKELNEKGLPPLEKDKRYLPIDVYQGDTICPSWAGFIDVEEPKLVYFLGESG